MIVNLFYWHEELLSVTRNVAQKRSEAIALPTDLQSRNFQKSFQRRNLAAGDKKIAGLNLGDKKE
jgi:hypothetical protein